MKRQQMRNLFTAMFISQGTPLVFGGDEWMRTQFGNNNAYSTWADNEWNWFRWGEWRNVTATQRYRMHDFVRETQPVFVPTESIASTQKPTETCDWMEDGTKHRHEWRQLVSQRHIMIHHYDDSSSPELLILLNMENWNHGFCVA